MPDWNPSGYLWNVVARADVNSPATRPALPQSTTERPAVFRETCLVCHQDDVIRQQRLTREQWDRELNKMAGWGARIRGEDRSALLDYLVTIR